MEVSLEAMEVAPFHALQWVWLMEVKLEVGSPTSKNFYFRFSTSGKKFPDVQLL